MIRWWYDIDTHWSSVKDFPGGRRDDRTNNGEPWKSHLSKGEFVGFEYIFKPIQIRCENEQKQPIFCSFFLNWGL